MCSIAQVGNYDYLVDWVFTQNGVIRVDVGLTGIDAPTTARSTTLGSAQADQETRFGALVAPNLVAPNHSHFFGFRLDVDVDGRNNSFVVGHLEGANPTPGPRKSVWTVKEGRVDRERDARFDHGKALWKVVNPHRTNARGYPTGHVVETHSGTEPLLKKEDLQRAAFIGHTLWVTRHNPDERFAAGETPNQHPRRARIARLPRRTTRVSSTPISSSGSPSATITSRSPRTGRCCRSSRCRSGRPANFFDRNPAPDLRRAPFETQGP